MITAHSKRIGLYTALILIVFPVFMYADTVTNPNASPGTGNTGITYVCKEGTPQEGDCTFANLITATLNVVKFGVTLALGFSPIVLAYAGYNYMISGDNPSKRKEANKMLWSVVVGIVFVLAAWLIVNLITNTLLGKSLDNFLV